MGRKQRSDERIILILRLAAAAAERLIPLRRQNSTSRLAPTT